MHRTTNPLAAAISHLFRNDLNGALSCLTEYLDCEASFVSFLDEPNRFVLKAFAGDTAYRPQKASLLEEPSLLKALVAQAPWPDVAEADFDVSDSLHRLGLPEGLFLRIWPIPTRQTYVPPRGGSLANVETTIGVLVGIRRTRPFAYLDDASGALCARLLHSFILFADYAAGFGEVTGFLSAQDWSKFQRLMDGWNSPRTSCLRSAAFIEAFKRALDSNSWDQTGCLLIYLREFSTNMQ